MDMVGYEVMAEWFKRAQERHPNARLAVNEFGMLPSSGDAPTIEPYLETVQRIRDDGGPVSMLGIQGHMGGAFTPPTRLYQILNRLAEPELPIRINEFTLRQEQEAVAERYAADFLTVMFSHPSVIGVHTWTFDVMFNEDGSHTPAGRAWHQLIRETWWTDEEAATNLSGEVTVPEAYYGQYRMVIRRDGMELDTWVRHIPNGSPFILHLR